MKLVYTRYELGAMSNDELRKLQRSLVQFLNTPDEKKARILNNQIGDILHNRSGYGM